MHHFKKSFSTKLRERLADPIFFLLLIGFLVFFMAFVMDFDFQDVINTSQQDNQALKVSKEVEEYVAFVYENRNSLKDNLQKVDNLLSDMDHQSQDWKDDMESQSEEVINLCNEVLEKKPPKKFEEFHELYSLSVIKFKEAMEYLDPGADNHVFASDLEDAKKLRRAGDSYFKAAFEKFSAIEK